MSMEDPPRYAPVGQKLSDLLPDVAMSEPWFTWLLDVKRRLSPGLTATVTLAKLTGGGTNGSLTFVNGILTAVTQPT